MAETRAPATLVRYQRCPECGYSVSIRTTFVPVAYLPPGKVPHQRENGVRFFKWQCRGVESHNGQWTEPEDRDVKSEQGADAGREP